MGNITSLEYPFLANRQPKVYLDVNAVNPLGMISIDNKLYIVEPTGLNIVDETGVHKYSYSFNNEKKTLQKMGSVLCIFPDKVCFSTIDKTFSNMANTVTTSTSVSVTLANATGGTITAHDEAYYNTVKPKTGDYLLTQSDSKSVLKEFNGVSEMWVTVYTTYIQFTANGIGNGFKKGDGVKISIDLSDGSWEEGKTIFPNTDDNVHYYNTVVLKNVEANKITFTGLLNTAKNLNKSVKIERIVPDIAFVTEANNRLWGCNAEGTEIYACALGDATNWNCFEGISTDSWAMTVGSDGDFTGAYTYMGYPMFFKENSIIKIAISATGAHQSKETVCRGVAKGCHNSLAVVNELLFYKSISSICSYDGSLPTSISNKVGDLIDFEDCYAGADNNIYILSGYKNSYKTYNYDTRKGIFVLGDRNKFTDYASCAGELYAIENNNEIVSFSNTTFPVKRTEEAVESFVESKDIDYTTPDSKYVTGFVIKTAMEFGTTLEVYMRYDNEKKWTRVAKIKARGSRVTNIPIRPKRCEHYAFRLEGKGNYKVQQIVKTFCEGSDLY